MLPTITAQQLSFFAAVVETGGFTAAARRLGTDKGRVSRAVAGLEDELGVRLLDRTTRTISMTEEGRRLYRRATSVLNALLEAETEARASRGDVSGTLRITCGPEFGRLRANAWFAEVMRWHPELSIDVHYTARVLDLATEDLDVAVRLGSTDIEDYVVKQVGELRYGLFASSCYLDRHPAPMKPHDLYRHDLIAHRSQRDSRTLVERARPSWNMIRWTLSEGAATAVVERDARYQSNDVFAVRDLCQAGFGVALLPLAIVEHEPPCGATNSLQRLLGDWAAPPVGINLVFPPARRTDPRVRSLVEIASAKNG